MRVFGRLLLMAACALAVAGGVAAQDMQPCTTVSHFNVALGQEERFMELVEELDTPLFDRLMKEGKVLAWGVSVPVMHEPGAPTHSVWWTTPSMAEMDTIIAELEAQEKKILEENPEFFASFVEMVDLSTHADRVFRDLVFGAGKPPAEGARPYVWIFTLKTLPGEDEEFVASWTELRKPILEKLAQAGLVHAYGLSIQEIRYTGDFSHYVWVSVPDFASYEKARALFIAETKKETPEQRAAMTALLHPDAGRTFVLRHEIFHVAGR